MPYIPRKTLPERERAERQPEYGYQKLHDEISDLRRKLAAVEERSIYRTDATPSENMEELKEKMRKLQAHLIVKGNENQIKRIHLKQELKYNPNFDYDEKSRELDVETKTLNEEMDRFETERTIIRKLDGRKIRYAPPSPQEVITSNQQLIDGYKKTVKRDEEEIQRIRNGVYSQLTIEQLQREINFDKERISENEEMLRQSLNGFYECIECNYLSFDKFVKCPKCGVE
jgi:hypothetical protein